MVLLHIGIPLIYGFCISNTTSYINLTSILSAIALALLTIAGFGLVFSYLKRLAWSGIGFAFLITALCVEIYPLVNAFWTKVRLDNNPTSNTFTSSKFFTLLVSNFDVPTGANYANTITTGFKCALAVLAAFSSILGRAGSLECLIVTLFGIVGFELNRQIIINLATDSFGTYSIFTFGGFMGLALGFILFLREKREADTNTEKHPNYTSNSSTVSVAIFGALIIFTFFPFLALDLDAYTGINKFNIFTGPFYIIIAMGAGVIGSVIVSCIINGHLIIRDLIHSPLAGGIIAGSASFFITNPVYALVVGFTGGATQAFIQNYF
jgi:positive regulator of sigma E activity